MTTRTFFGAGWVGSYCKTAGKARVGILTRGARNVMHVIEARSDTPDNFVVRVRSYLPKGTADEYMRGVCFERSNSTEWQGEVRNAGQFQPDFDASGLNVDGNAPVGRFAIVSEALEYKGTCPGDVWRREPRPRPPAQIEISVTY